MEINENVNENQEVNEADGKIAATEEAKMAEVREAANQEAEAANEETEAASQEAEAANEETEAESEEAEVPEDKPKVLSDKEAEAVIEAILFTMGDTVEISKLADVTGLDLRTTKKILKKMEERYQADDRGIMLTQFESAVQLCTKPETYEYLIKIAKNPKKIVLTDTVIETLSIIAYKQPVTRLDVENIRGVNCDHAINKLLEFDLITELGRLDAPGRPILFGTTEQFLRCFGVKSLEELPELSTMQMEEFKAQAEAEVKIRLD